MSRAHPSNTCDEGVDGSFGECGYADTHKYATSAISEGRVAPDLDIFPVRQVNRPLPVIHLTGARVELRPGDLTACLVGLLPSIYSVPELSFVAPRSLACGPPLEIIGNLSHPSMYYCSLVARCWRRSQGCAFASVKLSP